MIKFKLWISQEGHYSFINFEILEMDEKLRGRDTIYLSDRPRGKIVSRFVPEISFSIDSVTIFLRGREEIDDDHISKRLIDSTSGKKYFERILYIFKNWAESLNLSLEYDLVSEVFSI